MKSRGVELVLWAKFSPLLEKWYSHVSVYHVWVKCWHSHITGEKQHYCKERISHVKILFKKWFNKELWVILFNLIHKILILRNANVVFCVLTFYKSDINNCIISLKREAWVHKTNLSQPIFIEAPAPSQESDYSCIYVLVVSLCLCDYDYSIGFWYCSDSETYCSFILLWSYNAMMKVKNKPPTRICSNCHKHFPFLSSFMTYHRVCN